MTQTLKPKQQYTGKMWSREEDAALDRALAEGLPIPSAAIRLSSTFKRPISRNAVNHRLARRRSAAAAGQTQETPVDLDLDSSIPITWDDLETSPATSAAEAAPDMAPARPTDPVEETLAREREQRAKKQVASLVEQLREARSRQTFIDSMTSLREPPRIMPRERSGLREMTAVVLASDWHVEETVDPVSVAGRNEYNLTIAEQRIKRFFNAIIWHFEHNRASGRISLRDLVLWLGGDLITGYIHEELLESNALSPSQTIRWLLPLLRDGIATLLDRLDLVRLIIPCSHGNHGRTTQKIRVSTGAANSFEWLLYWSLADEFRSDPRVIFEITNSAHQYVQVYDFTLHFHHGDDVQYQGGVGGIGIPLLKAVPMWDLVKAAHVHNIGHFHQLLDFQSAVVNGSLIGYSPYSLRIRAKFEPPRQALYLVDSKRGKADGVRHLWVDEREPALAA